MSAWRVITTDSESLTGVAPVCPVQDQAGDHQQSEADDVWQDTTGVYSCCPDPHIETWSEATAKQLAKILTAADAEICS